MPEVMEAPEAVLTPSSARLGAAISSLGVSVPANVVENAEVASRLGVSERWIVERTGVERRRIASEEETLTQHAVEAGGRALAAAGLEPAELDLVLVATMSHDQLTPNAAPLVAAELGADRAGALDVGAACNGFISALAVATAQIESSRATSVLTVGADFMSRITDPNDRGTGALFGDGAGAVVMRAVDPPGRIGPVVLGADGGRAALVRAGREEGILRMKGHDTFRQAVDRLCEATLAAVAAAGRELGEVDLFVYHQANSRIIRAVGERLAFPLERAVDCLPNYGNTSAASIPIALADAQERGLLVPGATVLIGGFGGGLTWGATLIEWGQDGA